MKKWLRGIIIAAVPLTLGSLFFKAFFENYNQENLIAATAFKDHYIPFTQKGEECLALDQELQHQSLLLAGTMGLARKELARLVQEDFHVTSAYEPIIKTTLLNFNETQDAHSSALKNANSCWIELKRLMEETAVAAGVYDQLKVVDPQMVEEEGALNKQEHDLRAELIDPVNGERLYDGFIRLLSTQDSKELKVILTSFDRDFESLIRFREGMVNITSRRVSLRERFYIARKELFASALSSSRSTGFFMKTLWPF
ncbi:hypothetical protein OVV68_06450 [Pseudomonas aeruginosa]|uniref:hypothetical protein n=1 Tax=Pseudomonas aeruginosa TaxID=287 RepID=UPI0018E04CE3|nr:hypothetical protein [Pseudomonas aeruginosa]MBI7027086.1 hypothetical protein [Pseudomonas aeruginosa]MBI9166092.1 hypothetical protein [Pseudomonas aeruginosa]MCO4019166.1 hypothetical protein [Pseudomonas aeruginosa]MCY0310901.1 hypothetical protein [Pseudomonas aeruginosa]MCY0512853.1 hypothetical protein [Pseudomonas aeruginosa]